jgi:hypothetical protein
MMYPLVRELAAQSYPSGCGLGDVPGTEDRPPAQLPLAGRARDRPGLDRSGLDGGSDESWRVESCLH